MKTTTKFESIGFFNKDSCSIEKNTSGGWTIVDHELMMAIAHSESDETKQDAIDWLAIQ